MKKNIILSINPKWYNKILSGEKKYELRKKLPADIAKIYLYVTKPVQKITAIIRFDKIIYTDIFSLYEITKNQTGLTDDEYLNYFINHNYGYAIKIKNIIILNKPITIKNPPQKYKYVTF